MTEVSPQSVVQPSPSPIPTETTSKEYKVDTPDLGKRNPPFRSISSSFSGSFPPLYDGRWGSTSWSGSANIERSGSGSYYYEGMDSPTRDAYIKEERDPENEPAFSRVFVVCGKDATEEALSNLFAACGKIESCKIIRDKANNNESKGVAYIKYDKASAAALAIESLNGKKLVDTEESTALKVMIADAKGSKISNKTTSKEPEDTPARSRLFVICPKDMAEETLIEKFKTFGDFEYCKLNKDKQSGESKGCGYVKFSKSSTAAFAMESVNGEPEPENGATKVRALIAHPRAKRTDMGRGPEGFPPAFRAPMGFGMQPYFDPYSPPMSPYHAHPHQLPRQRLFIVHHKGVTQEQLSKLFARFPGMEYCDLKKDKTTGESKGFAYVNYSTPQAALMAKEQLDGTEFPALSGHNLKVIFAEPLGVKNNTEMSAMERSFAQMMSFPIGSPSISRSNSSSSPTMSPSQNQPYPAEKNIDPPGSRLFIVMMGTALPEYVLHNVFSQFAGLEYIRMQKEKKYGYVKYNTAESAQYAMSGLDGIDIGSTRLKVQIAHAPNSAESKNKRQRT